VEPRKLSMIQEKMLAVLADGMPHKRQELIDCIGDELADYNNLHPHLTAIRRIIRPMGHDIICQLVNRQHHYRHVLLLPSAYNGHS
jgi:hypothetical protein